MALPELTRSVSVIVEVARIVVTDRSCVDGCRQSDAMPRRLNASLNLDVLWQDQSDRHPAMVPGRIQHVARTLLAEVVQRR
jgi:hypothetical protein